MISEPWMADIKQLEPLIKCQNLQLHHECAAYIRLQW